MYICSKSGGEGTLKAYEKVPGEGGVELMYAIKKLPIVFVNSALILA